MWRPTNLEILVNKARLAIWVEQRPKNTLANYSFSLAPSFPLPPPNVPAPCTEAANESKFFPAKTLKK